MLGKMSSMHYKFKAALEHKTLTFDGLHISVGELKHLICENENIRIEWFDLVLTNASTKREYSEDEELVPRNTLVIVRRLPKKNATKLPKTQHDLQNRNTKNSAVGFGGMSQFSSISYIEPMKFSKMTEEQRLAHVSEVSCQKYLPSNYQKNPINSSTTPPPSYVCDRCRQSAGHWSKNCPLPQKLSKGIPMSELMETTRDNPNAMFHTSSGKFVVPIMHHQARLQQRKHEPFPGPEAAATVNLGIAAGTQITDEPPSSLVQQQASSSQNK